MMIFRHRADKRCNGNKAKKRAAASRLIFVTLFPLPIAQPQAMPANEAVHAGLIEAEPSPLRGHLGDVLAENVVVLTPLEIGIVEHGRLNVVVIIKLTTFPDKIFDLWHGSS